MVNGELVNGGPVKPVLVQKFVKCFGDGADARDGETRWRVFGTDAVWSDGAREAKLRGLA